MKTPQGKPLVVPSEKLAAAILAEWQGQGEKIRKELFRVTPLACVAIDLAADKRDAVLEDVVPYIDTDATCYRAGDIDELSEKQQKLLDPLLVWVKATFGIELVTTGSMMPIVQAPGNSAKLTTILQGYSDWKLAAYSVSVKSLGSAVLALALVEGRLTAGEAYSLAHLEETYETEKWGVDDEKEKHLTLKKGDLQAVEEFLGLL